MSKLGEDFEGALAPARTDFDIWIADLSDENRADLFAYAADSRLKHRRFFDVVKDWGCPAGREKLTKWRKANGFTS